MSKQIEGQQELMLEEQIIRTEYSEVMQKSYIDYAMNVIVDRALPDVRDGLKPVQRRALYDMYELGIKYDKPYRKSARIVGDTMGKYHPHGDSSIYESIVVMTQDFKKGLPLVDGHGNFGSIEGDGAAAMRYTEARLKKVTQEAFLGDLDKDVVDFRPNFDETEKEPTVLPVRIPNLLINGAEGIAVGMATSIPPHNLGEVVDAVKAYIKNPDISTDELMAYSYSKLYGIKATGLRFFSVYGPYGRPDMAYYKFIDKIQKGEEIDVYNKGEMLRDFTYIDDVVECMIRLINVVPSKDKNDAYHKVYNVGSGKPVRLMDFIELIEKYLDKKAKVNMLPLQEGDMKLTYANNEELTKLIDYKPSISIEEGMMKFILWYKKYNS